MVQDFQLYSKSWVEMELHLMWRDKKVLSLHKNLMPLIQWSSYVLVECSYILNSHQDFDLYILEGNIVVSGTAGNVDEETGNSGQDIEAAFALVVNTASFVAKGSAADIDCIAVVEAWNVKSVVAGE